MFIFCRAEVETFHQLDESNQTNDLKKRAGNWVVQTLIWDSGDKLYIPALPNLKITDLIKETTTKATQQSVSL